MNRRYSTSFLSFPTFFFLLKTIIAQNQYPNEIFIAYHSDSFVTKVTKNNETNGFSSGYPFTYLERNPRPASDHSPSNFFF